MIDKLKQHYLKIGPGRFVAGSVIVLLILDLINSWYLKLYWIQKQVSTMMVHQSIRRSQLVLEDFSQDTIREMTGFVDNTFYFFLLLILLNNAFFYFFYLKRRIWAQGYVLFYTLTAALFAVAFILDNAGMGIGWSIYNVLTIFIYLYIYGGVKLLKAETVIIPEREKKGQ